MLMSAVQRLVRRAPGLARRAWGALPGIVRAHLRARLYPIALGRRGGSLVISVPEGATADSEVRLPTSVSIVIVTCRGGHLLEQCLRSVAAATPSDGVDLVVVANGARVELPPGMRLPVRVVANDENLGFAAAVNQGIGETRGAVVVLLNDDTVVPPGWLPRLVGHLERDPRLGLVCPVTNEIGSEAKVAVDYQDYAGLCRFAEARARALGGLMRETRLVPLFCAAVRRSVLDEVGGLDERYEVGMFEDDDLSESLRRAGYHLGIADDVFVHHVGQASFAALPERRYLAIWRANRRRFEAKWGRRWQPPEAS